MPKQPPDSSFTTHPVTDSSNISWRVRFRFLIPHVFTIGISVLLSLAATHWLMPVISTNTFTSIPHSIINQTTLLTNTVQHVPASATDASLSIVDHSENVVVTDTTMTTHTTVPFEQQQYKTLSPMPACPTMPLSSLTLPAYEATITALQGDIRTLWSAYYLSRAARQLADAEMALAMNDLAEMEQVLQMVGVSLDSAYNQSSEQHKGPISEFRLQVSALREDFYVRPERMDKRLRQLRQSMVSLVDVQE